MLFKDKIPEIQDIYRIAQGVKEYPVSAQEIIRITKSHGYRKNIVHFIEMFCDQIAVDFESRADFYTRATEFALLLCEERIQTRESTLSLQS
jgi:hypothetical protein